jgi:hypothetical protein
LNPMRRIWLVSFLTGIALVMLPGCQILNGNSGGGGGTLSVANASLNFGSVAVGSNKALEDTLTNNSLSSVTVSAVAGSSANLQVTGLTVPLTLAAGQSVAFTVQYKPSATGNLSQTLSFLGGGSEVLASVAATGSASNGGVLTLNPSKLIFGSVVVGSNQKSTLKISNTGTADLTINKATLSGAGFTITNMTLPLTLHAGSSVSSTLTYAPTTTGSFNGSVAFATTGAQGNVSLSLTGTGVNSGHLSGSPTSLAFGSITIGKTTSLSETLTNTGGASVTISQATVSGAGLSVSGLTLPTTLAGNQSVSFKIVFAPTAAGAVKGTLAITSNANSPLNISLSATALAQGSLTSSPSSASFGSITVGNNKTVALTVSNTGGSTVTVSSASVSGSGFSLTGPSMPATIAGGQSATFSVKFAPASAGAASGTLTINSNASNATLSVPLSGTGVSQGGVTANPTSLGFGSIATGSSKSLSGTLTNSGGTSVTISGASTSGAAFSLSGLTVPLTLGAGQSTSFTVKFAPTSSGSASGNVTVTSDGSNPSLSIPLSGTGAAPGSLSANPTSLSFGSVQTGSTASKSETVTNTGGATVSISQANVTGSEYSVSGLTLPTTLTASQSVTFTVKFSPSSTGTMNGSLSLVSDASNSPLSISLSGTGATPGQLAVSPTTLSFGSVAVGSSSALTGTLSASGASVTVSSGSSNSGEFTLSGITLPTTLTAGQSVGFKVTFAPQATGAASAKLTFTSNATNGPTTQSLSGSGTAPAHSVSLAWSASSGAVGYNIYRGSVTGGPYTMINPSLNTSTSYSDTTVAAGTTYYYVVTAVDSSSNESAYSNQAKAVVPSP